MKIVFYSLLAFSTTNLFVDAMQGGDYYTVTEVPYQAQLFFQSSKTRLVTFCGATIISENWLVSAAHCVGRIGMNINKARIGSSSTLSEGNLINITKIIVHGDYETRKVWDNDICLIKLETPIEFNELQQPIPIAREIPKVADVIIVSGFGDAHYGVRGTVLQVGRMPVISEESCRVNYTITKNMFCTNTSRIDLCFGDSGGPAVLNGKLVGVASQGCEYTAPNVFTKVANYYDWIIEHTGIKYDD